MGLTEPGTTAATFFLHDLYNYILDHFQNVIFEVLTMDNDHGQKTTINE